MEEYDALKVEIEALKAELGEEQAKLHNPFTYLVRMYLLNICYKWG